MRVRGVRNLLELPLVTAQQIHVGDVADVMVDTTEQRVLKLAINWQSDPPALSGPDADVPFRTISHFEAHQVVVQDEIGESAGLDLLGYDGESLVSASQALLDHEVVTDAGDRLGSLVDLYVDEEDGAIVGYELNTADPHQPTLILAPTTDMDLRGGQVVVPAGVRHVELPAEEEEPATSEAIAPDEVGLAFDARAIEPETDEEPLDPNEYPGGHAHREGRESPPEGLLS